MKVLVNEQLSPHKFKTPEGYLICTDAILARTGKQTYKRGEVFGIDCTDAESEVEIDRPEKEVFSEKTLASFENKPITVEHPDEDVNSSNWKDYQVGFVRDVKRGKTQTGEDVILGTLVIQDKDTIDEIMNGKHTELSCGYDCDIVDEANPYQRNIRGNHVALCQQGRAGIAKIVDSIKDAAVPDVTVQCYIIDGDKILIQDRVGPVWKGLAVPGGHVEEGESFEQACVREVKEETGLDVDNVVRFGVETYKCDGGEGVAVLYKTSSFNGTLRDSEEGRMMWMDINDVLRSNYLAQGFKDLLKRCYKIMEVEDSMKDERIVFGKDLKVGMKFKRYDGIYEILKSDNVGSYVKLITKRDGSQGTGSYNADLNEKFNIIDSIKDDFDQEYAKNLKLLEQDVKMAKAAFKTLKNLSASDIFKKFGYKKDGQETFYKEDGRYIKVIRFLDFDDVRYYVLKDGNIPAGWTITRTKWYDSIEDESKEDVQKKIDELEKQWDWCDDHNNHWKADEILKEIDELREKLKGMKDCSKTKDASYTTKTKQGYDIIEMWRDNGRIHIIFRRANDYGIGLGYNSLDGTWGQGIYNLPNLQAAKNTLKEEKPNARQIQDSKKYEISYKDSKGNTHIHIVNASSMKEAVIKFKRR